MKKLSDYHFTEEQIRTFYEKNKGPINYFYCEDEDADMLSHDSQAQYVATLVKAELARIEDFNEKYPYFPHLLRKGFQPSLQYILDRDEEYPFFEEDGSMKSNMATIFEAARTNVGLLQWLPDHHRNDPAVLLTAYFSNRNSFMRLDAYMDSDAFKFISEDLWNGNYYNGQDHEALDELIRIVKQSESTNFLLQLPHLPEDRYRLILDFFEEHLQRPFTEEELQIFKSFRTHDPITYDPDFKKHVVKVFNGKLFYARD